MSFWVKGKLPISKAGKSFSANIWGWHPIWRFCCEVYPPCRRVRGDVNAGDGLGPIRAWILGRRLLAAIEDGRARTFMENATYTQRQFDIEHREKMRAQFASMPEEIRGELGKVLDEPETERDRAADYVDLLREFALFCTKCGGFRIW